MINDYVNKLIENLPDDFKNNTNPLIIDLVLDGGIFNGSYLVGALYFLKEMEKRNYIRIERISGCSIGSIAAFLYFIDGLDLMSTLYNTVHLHFKQNYNLTVIKDLKTLLNQHIPDDICKKVNNKLYITYYNIKKQDKIVKFKYKTVDKIIEAIIKSSFVPCLIDGNILYQNKYIDGINPYIFKKEVSKKILYLDLFGYDKIGNLLNVKNEKTNFHRILSGLLDIHNFFIKKSNTQMCSFVNDWSISNISFNYLKFVIEKCCIYMTYLLLYAQKHMSPSFQESFIYKILSKLIKETFIILLETYCF